MNLEDFLFPCHETQPYKPEELPYTPDPIGRQHPADTRPKSEEQGIGLDTLEQAGLSKDGGEGRKPPPAVFYTGEERYKEGMFAPKHRTYLGVLARIMSDKNFGFVDELGANHPLRQLVAHISRCSSAASIKPNA